MEINKNHPSWGIELFFFPGQRFPSHKQKFRAKESHAFRAVFDGGFHISRYAYVCGKYYLPAILRYRGQIFQFYIMRAHCGGFFSLFLISGAFFIGRPGYNLAGLAVHQSFFAV